MPGQTFTDVQPIQQQQSFTSVTPLVPFDMTTGAGAQAYAQGQAQQVNTDAARQMHGAVSLMGHPASSQAQDDAFDAALQGGSKVLKPSLSGSAPNVPPGMEQTAHIAESVPAVAQAATSFVPGDVAAALVGKVLPS